MGQLEHYFTCKRNLNEENHCEELDSDNFRIAKTENGFRTTVICFGGNGTVDPYDINHLIKIVQGLVGVKESKFKNQIATIEDVDFIGIAYGKDKDQMTGNSKNPEKIETSSLTGVETAELALNIFAPLYMDEMGKILPKEQMLRNFNQITFFSHCWGAAEIEKIILQARQNMRAIGISEKVIDDAFGQVFSVSYAPWQCVSCPGLQVIPEKDLTITNGPGWSKISCDFLNKRFMHRNSGGHIFEEYKGEGTVAFKENEKTVSVIVSNMTQNLLDEHDVDLVKRDTKWRIDGEDIMYRDDVSKAMGVALSYSIASGIQNQRSSTFIPKLTPDEILQKVQSILGVTQNDKFADAIKIIQAENIGRER